MSKKLPVIFLRVHWISSIERMRLDLDEIKSNPKGTLDTREVWGAEVLDYRPRMTYREDADGNHVIKLVYKQIDHPRLANKEVFWGTSKITIPASWDRATARWNDDDSWSSVSGAGSYTLQQRINGGGWTTVSASAALSWNASAEASGTYGYQVQACNAVGCGPWSAVGTDTVTLPPIPATPSLTAPSTNATGSYTVSWTGVSNATSYTMQEQVNGGGWTTVSASAATSWAASVPNGTYGYRVQACGFSGCSAWSGTSTTVVTIPVPIAINGQSYQEGEQVAQGTGFARIGFAIAGGNTWQVFVSNGNLSSSTVAVSGAVPATAVTVQYTWTFEGVPSGDLTSGGAVINGASSPTAISGNPSSEYTTTGFGSKSVERGETYQLIVTFFNAAGANVSSSTATMTASVVGSE